jgi:trehalose synthase-fused probable maltokinase
MMDDVTRDTWLDTSLPALLRQFVPTRRWFSGKARMIDVLSIDDVAWLDESGCRAFLIVDVQYTGRWRERYTLPLAFVSDPAGLPIIGRVSEHVWAVDAATDSPTVAALLTGLDSAREPRTRRGGVLRPADASEATRRALRATSGLAIEPIGAEQSNTSLRVAQTFVFKLFRKLYDGENPELEVSRFLTSRTTFRALPALHGSLAYVPAYGQPATIGVVQDWIQNVGDGWSYVLDELRKVHSGSSGHALIGQLKVLGATTAHLHAALASDESVPSFAPEPVSILDVESWYRSMLERAWRTLDLIEWRMQAWPEDSRVLAETLLRHRSGRLVNVPMTGTTAHFQKIRVHGDYHLGQTLKTSDGFVVIDFEGEPARPLAQRRQKTCALKDVAGMLRSFHYATETVRREEPNADRGLPPDLLRAAFLEGYLSSARGAVFLPGTQMAVEEWLRFFELDKALYEVEYEISHRPAWIHIPLKGVVDILDAQRRM